MTLEPDQLPNQYTLLDQLEHHELVPFIRTYLRQGARNTSYNVNLKKFYFMALADKFVADRKEFSVVALAPFVTITAILIILFFVAGTNWQLTVIGVFLAHTAMCSGDFGLLSYFEFHRDKEVVTYDDVESRRSFFYARSKE